MAAMTIWEDYLLEDRIRGILEAASYDQDHHFGHPFLTSYQIAISFAELYPDDTESIGKEVGGKGTGLHHSLAQYFARELSQRIKNGRLTGIKGRFLHGGYLKTLEYDSGEGTVESSSGHSGLSMFRLCTDKPR